MRVFRQIHIETQSSEEAQRNEEVLSKKPSHSSCFFLASLRFDLLFILLGIAILLLSLAAPVKALPEYSAQTGEPCMTCHISPSGGGPRGPRGQAWVGGGKPGQVPQLAESLELLGVKLDRDPSQFQAPTGEPTAAQPMLVNPAALDALQRRLQSYDGN